ncbi:hypothetical protein F0269_25055, partial [Escherichia coli]|nr:hypothetical protein [Escherichia coli]
MRQRDVFSDQASIASWALFTLHRKKLYEYRNANGVKISVKMRSPEHYEQTPGGSVMRQQSHGLPVNWLNDKIIFRESECGQR